MAEPTESLGQKLIHSATDPFSLVILAGVASSSSTSSQTSASRWQASFQP